MTNKAITQIWSALALLGLYASCNTVLKAQGSEIYFSFPRMDKADRYAVTIYGMVISIPVLLLLFRLTLIYAKREARITWSERLPIAFDREVDPKQKLGKYYQGAAFLFFFILPMVGQGMMINKFFKGSVFDKENSNQLIANTWKTHLSSWQSWNITFDFNRFRYGTDINAEGLVTYIPGVEPWLFLMAEVYLFSFFLFTTYFIFFNNRSE